MYDYIKGIFTYKNASTKGYFVTIESNLTGYLYEVTQKDFNLLNEENAEVKMFTVLLHKEDKMSLCGFLKREERDMFNILTSVSGVGSKMALALINSFTVNDLVGFVLDENYKALTTAKGVGQKLAQKIILELKGKLNSSKDIDIPAITTDNSALNGQNIEDARMVLFSLGYENNEITAAIKQAIAILDKNSSAEEILKKSLQILSA
ncbi:Holliday junction branch migration protein RuvA [bacterium]|nr:Holliday junction branch migration protein RuvA [bacterium]